MRKLMLLLALPNRRRCQAHAGEVVHIVGSGAYSNCWEWKQAQQPEWQPHRRQQRHGPVDFGVSSGCLGNKSDH